VRVFATLAGLATLAATSTTWAQTAVRDQSGSSTITTSGVDQSKAAWQQRWAGSTAELTTYIGSGTFYTSGYRDPYVSDAFYFRPQYNLGTKYKLSLAGRVYFEEEWTKPDISNGRSWNLLDSIIYLNAKNLYTTQRGKVTFFGGLRATIPLSFESRYAHLVTALGVSGGAHHTWEFGQPNAEGKRWNLTLTFGEGFSKAIRTSETRGDHPGDTTGCRTAGTAGYTGGPGAAENDRCGGPLNTSYAFSTSGAAALSRGRYSLSLSLIVMNEFKYSIDSNTYAMVVAQSNQVPTGRADITWGVVSAGYDINDHFSVSLGLASYQPAMNSRYTALRFPFFDFSGGNANNFTQVMVGVSGTL
jgi:hypothetical protein